MSKNPAISKPLTDEELAILNDGYPVSDDESSGLKLPRLEMLAKDITEETGTGKNKKITIVNAAGEFFTEEDKGEVNDEGKKVWTREYIDATNINVIIVFHRRQLRKYDSSLEKFISTPIFDNKDQIIPLYLDRQVIKRGTQDQLQSLYPAISQKGKPTSTLKEEAILFVIYNNKLYQMNITQSSKWMFKTYKKSLNPSTVVTNIDSIEDEFGGNVFRKMTFTNYRMITSAEFTLVKENQDILKKQVESDQKFYLGNSSEATADAEFEAIGSGTTGTKVDAARKKNRDF